jgi:transcriptional regulator with XRE-family HTH domain
MDFTILEVSGITQGEMAFMCKTSRQTISGWVSGAHAPHAGSKAKLERILLAIRSATEAMALPLPESEGRIRTATNLTVRPTALKIVKSYMR